MTSYPNIRAEKSGNRNRDDLRVMIAGTLFCIFLIMVQPLAFKTYDYMWADRPFVTATVEVVYVEGADAPVIMYDADATQLVSGKWIASVYEIMNGEPHRITTRRGDGSYHNREDEPKIWTWHAFFDNEQDVSTPDVPEDIFMVCVKYDVRAKDSNIADQTPKYCSRPYDPANPMLVLDEILIAEDPR